MTAKFRPTDSPLPTPQKAPTAFYSGENYLIEESIGYLIKQLMLSIHRDVDAKMLPLDLTAMQWGPLLLLSQGKCETAADIARHSSVDTSAVTRMLDRLEAKGLIVKTRSLTDRRIIHLKLTETGEIASRQIPFVLAEQLNKRLQGFEQAEVDILKSLLKRMLANG